MSVSKISKITLFLPADKIEIVSALLHDLECVEIISHGAKPSHQKPEEYARLRSSVAVANMDKIKHVIDVIQKHYFICGGHVGLSNIKYTVTPEEEEKIVSGYDWKSVYDKVNRIVRSIALLEIRKNSLANLIQQLEPWSGVNIPLKNLKDTERLRFVAAHIPRPSWDEFASYLSDRPCIVEKISEDKRSVYFGFIYSPSISEEVKKLRNKYGFVPILFPPSAATPQKILKRFSQMISGIAKRIERHHREIAALWPELPRLKILYDHNLKIKMIFDSQRLMLNTRYNAYFYAWIENQKIDELRRALDGKRIAHHILSEPPAPGEDVPIVLRNGKLVEPFEIITDLYGKPNYSEADPTPYLSPFFALFFGICMADAVYGALLLAAGIALYLKAKGVFARKFAKLLIYCATTTTAAGVLTGSYAGNLFDKFEIFRFMFGVKQKLVLLDPLKNSLMFLGISLLLGLVQTIFGTILKVVHTLKKRKWRDVALSDLPVLGIQVAFPIMILSFMFRINLAPQKLVVPFFFLSCILIMVNQWIINEGIVLKLFQMFFAVYGAITGNALSDPLSYSRLFALGLSTGLLAMAFNEIASLLFGAPYVGFALGVLFLLGGHTFNIAIGSLGAYVHTSRLQYLEFFNKFFQGGGREMKPLRWEKKYTV